MPTPAHLFLGLYQAKFLDYISLNNRIQHKQTLDHYPNHESAEPLKTQTATAQPQAATPGLLLGFPHVISSITLPPNCITTSNKRWIIILQNLRASRASRNSSGRRPPRHRWLTSSSDFLK